MNGHTMGRQSDDGMRLRDNWLILWTPPMPKYSGIGKLSIRDHYRIERSRKRYLRRPDAIRETAEIFTGEIGRLEGFSFYLSGDELMINGNGARHVNGAVHKE